VNVANNGNSSFSQSIQAGPQWLGTARLSTGVAMDRVLLYATGGFAYGEANMAVSATYRDTANSVCSGNFGNSVGGTAGSEGVGYSCNGGVNTGSSFTYSNAAQWQGNRSKLMTGFAVGSGMAYAMTDNIILKLEGYYYNLGSISTTAYGTGTQTLTVNSGGNPAGATPGTRVASVTPFSVSRQIDGFIAKVGVQFKFDTYAPEPLPPVVAKY
jgi:outer membrane immunogenic protein